MEILYFVASILNKEEADGVKEENFCCGNQTLAQVLQVSFRFA
jgi:hypothetical protein